MKIVRIILGTIFSIAGFLHFKDEQSFRKIVPEYLPLRKTAVLLTGIVEMITGIYLIIKRPTNTMKKLINLFLISVMPANIYMARKSLPLGNKQLPQWILYARIPLQFVLIRTISKL